MATLQETIEKRYSDYLEKTKDWSEDMPTGQTGTCDLCNKRSELTAHHLVPKRLYKDIDNKLKSFLDKLTIDICPGCHGKLHPENTWKKDLIELEQVFKNEAKKLEAETNKRIEESSKETSKAKEEANNMMVKNKQLQDIIKGKEESIANSKKEIIGLKAKLLQKEQELDTMKKVYMENKTEAEAMSLAAHIFYNTLEIYKDEDAWKKEVLEEIKTSVKSQKAVLDKKTPSMRDLDLVLKKIGMMPLYMKDFDSDIADALGKNIQRIFRENLQLAVSEVFDLPLKDVQILFASPEKKHEGVAK